MDSMRTRVNVWMPRVAFTRFDSAIFAFFVSSLTLAYPMFTIRSAGKASRGGVESDAEGPSYLSLRDVKGVHPEPSYLSPPI
jgi:hypothetical protein